MYKMLYTDLTIFFLIQHTHAYSRNMCHVWQMYPLGSGGMPPFNWDMCTLFTEAESQVHKLQRAYSTMSDVCFYV